MTSVDGTLSKLDPDVGTLHAAYKPFPRGPGWAMYGTGGVAVHVAEDAGADGSGEEDSWLLYWVFDVSPDGDTSSRVIAVAHDASTKLDLLWTKEVDGIIEGDPVIG